MINSISNEAILASLMHQYGIKNIVFSGNEKASSIYKLIESMSQYEISIVTDERSAGYYALGIALETQEPVAVVAKSNKAASNFLPAIAEAYYQNVPVLVIAEELDLDSPINDALNSVTGITISLPKIYDELSSRRNILELCSSMAILNQHGSYPVFVSYVACPEIIDGIDLDIRAIQHYSSMTDITVWKDLICDLQKARGIAVFVDGCSVVSCDALNSFSKQFGCQIVKDLTFHGDLLGAISMSELLCSENIDFSEIDYLITISENQNGRCEKLLKKTSTNHICHWHISESAMYDPINRLSKSFCLSADEFIDIFLRNCDFSKEAPSGTIKYTTASKYTETNRGVTRIIDALAGIVDTGYIQYSYVQDYDLIDYIKWNENSKIVTMASDNADVGCLSSFLGLAYNNKSDCYLIIDNTSFEKDMNALTLHCIGNNVHILLINSDNTRKTNGISSPIGICEWCRDTGIEYINASSEDAALSSLSAFASVGQSAPVLMNVCI